jgi:hypothetical protein
MAVMTDTEDQKITFPDVFCDLITEDLPRILKHLQEDGSIPSPISKKVKSQSLQAILPMAFCWAGLDPQKRFHRSPELYEKIGKLAGYLLRCHDDKGCLYQDGEKGSVLDAAQAANLEKSRVLRVIDQRLLYSWVEALKILREAGADFDFDAWSNKIQKGCEEIIDHRLKHTVGMRRFVGRAIATSANHLSLYLAAVYRTGQVLNRKDFCEFVLPIARAFAEDIHPDGYWEEHGDLLRQGGPTPGYNYITHCGMALMYEWTKEVVFLEAIKKSTSFFANFSYPDGTYLELIDERQRGDGRPRPWGLFGFSHTPEGRGLALQMVETIIKREKERVFFYPENTARHCENFLYWHSGEMAAPPFARIDHEAKMTLPAGIFRSKKWCIGLSAMYASQREDPAYRNMSFALDRQKLFSVRHDDLGRIICGANAKDNPKHSTFATCSLRQIFDYYPSGGRVGHENGSFFSRATYKSFYGSVELKPINESELQIVLSVDPVGSRGPFNAGFNLLTRGEKAIKLSDGKVLPLSEEPMEIIDLGGELHLGPITISGPQNMKITWPVIYPAKNPDLEKGNDQTIRVNIDLTFDCRAALFTLQLK